MREELKSPNAGTYLGDPLIAGAIEYDSRLGIPRAAGPILGPDAESAEPPDDHFDAPERRIDLSSTEPERVSVFRDTSAPQTPSSGHTYSMSIRPGETKTQRIELPGLTLELVITMAA